MTKHLVRATIEPSVVREIDDAELLDLARQGFIHSYEKTEAAAAVLEGTVFKTTSRKWAPAEKKADVVTAPAPAGASAPADDDTKGA